MFEEIILVRKYPETVGGFTEEVISVHEVRKGAFTMTAKLPARMQSTIIDSLHEQGYTRAVPFNPDDAISGLYNKA